MTKINVEIKSYRTNPRIEEYVHVLKNVFDSDDIQLHADIKPRELKSFTPIIIEIDVNTIQELGNLFFGWLVGEYVFKPAFDYSKNKIIQLWKVASQKRTPEIPLQIIIRLLENDIEIITEPYLLDETWISDYFINLYIILRVLESQNLINDCRKIRLISEQIDDIKVLVHASPDGTSKPSHIIDIQSETIKELSTKEIQNYRILDDDERRKQHILHQSELYQQLVERLKK